MEPSSTSSSSAAAAATNSMISNHVGQLLMAAEELRRAIARTEAHIDDVLQWLYDLESMLQTLNTLQRLQADHDHDDITTNDLVSHCRTKAVAVLQATLERMVTVKEPNDDDDDDDASLPERCRAAQGAVARCTELNLQLRGAAAHDEIVQLYVKYQRTTLRGRVKQKIAELVQVRQQRGRTMTMVDVVRNGAPHPHHANDDDDDESLWSYTAHHAPVVSTVLGQAAVLAHPLMLWQQSLPNQQAEGEEGTDDNFVVLTAALHKLCSDALRVLDEQAQLLTQTVVSWFWEDRKALLEQALAVPPDESTNLAALDGLVDEMAMVAQLLARYQALLASSSTMADTLPTSAIVQDIFPEWTWKYAAVERALAMLQWHKAVHFAAAPLPIVMGLDICVPSVVEDAQYLSVKALERAASTRCAQAVGTVTHAVSHDVWSTDDAIESGVWQALLEKRGCWQEPDLKRHHDNDSAAAASKKAENAFASALLDALDDDLQAGRVVSSSASGRSSTAASPPRSTRASAAAPHSGNFLSFVGSQQQSQQMQLDANFCALNGWRAAANACRALVGILDGLLDPEDDDAAAFMTDGKATAMLQLAREELTRYAAMYDTNLTAQIDESMSSYCGRFSGVASRLSGDAFSRLQAFFEEEDYILDATSIGPAEADDRLTREMLGPLEESTFLAQLSNKMESSVVTVVIEKLIAELIGMVTLVLWSTPKQVSDWGSLLLAQETRMLQAFVTNIAKPPADTGLIGPHVFSHCWERLIQVVTVLQLEKPADWFAYHTSSVLTPEELQRSMALRPDFSADAVLAVVAKVTMSSSNGDGAASGHDPATT